jgi:hypothetical protein
MEKFMGLWTGLAISFGFLTVCIETPWSLWFNVGLFMVGIGFIVLAYCGMNATMED